MSSLQEALLAKKGQLSGITVRPQNSEEEIARLNAPKEKPCDHFSVEDLDGCPTMRKFKEMAEKILLAGTGSILEILRKAHRFKDNSQPENKKFIWFFLELRNHLQYRPIEQHNEILRKAFRKSGATFELSKPKYKHELSDDI